jgi:hypothetical protein
MFFGTNLFYFIYSHTPTPSHFNTEIYCLETQGSHGSNYENNDFMECDSMLSGRNVPLPFLKSFTM